LDKIIITDLLAHGIVGIHEWERKKPQDIIINIVLFADLKKAGKSDNIEDCIDYRSLSEKVLCHAESAQRLTLEALADDIAQLCLEDPRVQRVRVRVEKPEAINYTKYVGVEVERSL